MSDLFNFEWPALSTVLRTMYELHTYRSKKTKEEATVETLVKHNDLDQCYCNGASTVKPLYSEYIVREN